MLRHGTLYDVDILTDAMRANLGDMTFQVQYDESSAKSKFSMTDQPFDYRKRLIELVGS